MLFLSMRSVFLLPCYSFLEEGVFSYIALATMLISFLFIAVSSFLLTTVVGRWIELIEQANVLIFHSCSFRRRVWRACPLWWAWPSLPSLRLFPIPFRPSTSPRRDSVPWLWPLPWVLWLSMYISLVEIEGNRLVLVSVFPTSLLPAAMDWVTFLSVLSLNSTPISSICLLVWIHSFESFLAIIVFFVLTIGCVIVFKQEKVQLDRYIVSRWIWWS